jgi:ribosomal protein L37AE/L43A
MPLFCKQCESRRFPEHLEAEKQTLWLCKKCENFVNDEDVIVREQTDEERSEAKRKLEEFEKTINFPKGKLVRRKGVN